MSARVQLLGALAALCCGAAASGAWAADLPPSMNQAARASGAGDTGAEIYKNICQGCHMPEGQGATGAGHYPALAHSDDLAGRLGQVVAATVVLNGRNGMPAFGHSQRRDPTSDNSVLSDAQIAEIVNYVRSHFGNSFKERLTAAQVAALRHPVAAPGLGF